MKCTGLSVVSMVALIAGAIAGDIAEDIQLDFHMGLFPRQTSTNLQAFSGALGGAQAAPITKSNNADRPFEVEGDTFPDFSTAADRACDNQKNACAQLANKQQGTFEVSDCDQQNTQCKQAATSATTTSFTTLTSQNADFDFFCE